VQLKDEDVQVDLASFNGPQDRLVIVVTEPLTLNENWVAMKPGELQVFVDGQPMERALPACLSKHARRRPDPAAF
jgi:glutamine amidotransferase